jgi:thermosome
MLSMAGQLAGAPVLILREGAERKRGRDAQSNNIMAGKVIAEAVRSTLGPKGMDKMLVDTLGDVVITNDGATILDEMDVEHPAAKMMVEVAKAQDDEVGDGTTTAVVLAGDLLKKAEELLEQHIHATVIVQGFRKAEEKALKILDGLAVKVDPADEATLTKIASTSMTGKGAETTLEHLAELAVQSVKQVVTEKKAKKGQKTYDFDIDYVKIEKKEGGTVSDSTLVRGVLVDKERVQPAMPRKVTDAKIAVLSCALEVKDTETDAKIQISDPRMLESFLDQEEEMLREMVNKVVDSGANVLMCQKGIDDLAQHYLTKAGILAARRVKKSDVEKLARATSATIVTNVQELSSGDLGSAGLVEERKVAGDDMIFVEECKDPKAVTILVRGGTEHVVDETERALHDAISVVGLITEDPRLVYGGGACETTLSSSLNEFAKSVSGREGLAVEAYADAVKQIPRTLAENAGMDPIDTVQDLVAQSSEKGSSIGLDVANKKVADMSAKDVVEAVGVKQQAIKSATEAVSMLLRIDDVISSKGGGGGGPGKGPDAGDDEDGDTSTDFD